VWWNAQVQRKRFLVTCAIASVAAAAFLPGSGFGSPSAAGLTSEPLMGSSVALSADGTTALVGAPGVARGAGAVYVYRASATGSWSSATTPAATLTNKSGAASGQFGWAVALSADGTTAFVGAPSVGGGAGAIYVFHVPAENAWASSPAPAATLSVTHGQIVGYSLALSVDGTTLVSGAPFYNNFAGGAYVFHASSESAWAPTSTPNATLSDAAESHGDVAVGAAVAISGDGTTVLLGDSGNPKGGGAFLYHVATEGSWVTSTTPTAVLSGSHSADDALGNSVALSGDGTVALLGAPGVKSNTGAVEVFRSASEAAWSATVAPSATLTAAGGKEGNDLGEDIALSTDGDTALVTARGEHAPRRRLRLPRRERGGVGHEHHTGRHAGPR